MLALSHIDNRGSYCTKTKKEDEEGQKDDSDTIPCEFADQINERLFKVVVGFGRNVIILNAKQKAVQEQRRKEPQPEDFSCGGT